MQLAVRVLAQRQHDDSSCRDKHPFPDSTGFPPHGYLAFHQVAQLALASQSLGACVTAGCYVARGYVTLRASKSTLRVTTNWTHSSRVATRRAPHYRMRPATASLVTRPRALPVDKLAVCTKNGMPCRTAFTGTAMGKLAKPAPSVGANKLNSAEA